MKIAIVGTASSSVNLAPWEDTSWSIWALAWRSVPRADAIFEMHKADRWLRHAPPNYREQLSHATIPIYLREAESDLPTSVRYPMEDVLANLCPKGDEADFFTSSLAYMLALAITKLPMSIGLYGVDLLAEGEYAYQRPAMEYLIGLARGRGIKVLIPENSALCKANFRYGDNDGDGPFQKATGLTEEILQKRLDKYRSDRAQQRDKYEKAIHAMDTFDGAIQATESMLEQVKHFNRGGIIPS